MFVVDHMLREPEAEAPRIEITAEFARAIARREAERSGAPPSEAQIEAAIARFVREEALYREALALGLDRGDLIVRRRLVQKMELWLDAQTDAREPTDDELAAWHRMNADAMRAPGRTAIELVFVADRARAERVHEALEDGADLASLGDPFPHGRTIGPRTDAQLDTLLGDGVARAIEQVPVDRWSGPIEARAGVLFVRPTRRVAGRPPTLEEVHDRARSEIVEARRQRARERAIEAIVSRWEVTRADRGSQ